MQYVIEPEGGRLHWIVKCVDKGKLVEMHRFFRSPEKFVYHRGEHGEHETPAREALKEFFEKHPEVVAHIEAPPPRKKTKDKSAA
jgi:hypothetical protein